MVQAQLRDRQREREREREREERLEPMSRTEDNKAATNVHFSTQWFSMNACADAATEKKEWAKSFSTMGDMCIFRQG